VASAPLVAERPEPAPPAAAQAPPAAPPAPAPPPPVAAPPPPVAAAPEPEFHPANPTERDLLEAADAGNTDTFLSTLLLARILLPGGTDAADLLVDPARWHTEELDGGRFVTVFTSVQRLTAHLGPDAPAAWLRFTQLIGVWPDAGVSFALNPGTPIAATLPGDQVQALAVWAADVGLTSDEPAPAAVEQPAPAPPRPVEMQKTVARSQLPFYLERGYDRVSGFVHRANEVAHLRTPGQLYRALGLGWSGSPFGPDDEEAYVLRWVAHREGLYRIPYGGGNEQAMRAMEGWVVERPPFRGNGFAPSEGRDVIAEFKVDSVRLPHGAQLWRVDADGAEQLVAVLDADGPRWLRVGDA
jgi:hypothetical protein